MSIGLSKRTPIRGFIITLIAMVPVLVAGRRPQHLPACPPTEQGSSSGSPSTLPSACARSRSATVTSLTQTVTAHATGWPSLGLHRPGPSGSAPTSHRSGQSPGPATTSVNGVVTCRGSTYAYMGFEARWTTPGWQVVDVPTLDEAARTSPSSRASRPGAAVSEAPADLPPSGGGPLDHLAPYQPQTTCDLTPKPGMVGFQAIVLAAYPATSSYGISRDCSIGGRSEHKEGRAWDWAVAVSDPDEHAAAHQVFDWQFRADANGRGFAMARRLGVMYIIHNRHIWGSYRAAEGWRPYVGANPHTDHTYFSFSWEGARKQTSHWDGSPVHYGSAA